MKFLFVVVLALLCISQLSMTEASRSKRAISREKCPADSTQDQCEVYAKDKAAKKNSCARYEVSNDEIVWHSCGVKVCKDSSGNTYRATEKDLTKSYPDCCPKCH